MTALPGEASCRICRARGLDLILDLGAQPLANAFIQPILAAAAERTFPLELCRCPSCGHVQLSLTVAPELLFRDYPYASGTSDTIPEHFAAYAADVALRFVPPDGGFVVEIGSNDGTLLRGFDRTRVRVLGVEPARNIAAMAIALGIDTVTKFFDERVAREIAARHGAADAIIANNVVAHIDDLHGLLRGITTLLGPRGVFIAEFPYLVDLLERTEYDTIYHEHLSYFSVAAVADLVGRFGLELFDVRRTAIHGGSLRVFVGRDRAIAPAVSELLGLEDDRRIRTAAPFQTFASAVRAQREALRALLDELRAGGARLAGYGAAAKGNTLLNYCGIDASILAFIADRSPLKQGLLTPGGHIPVRPPEALLAERPTHTLLLAWNFADEVVRQQQAYRDAGGRFVVPIPAPRII